MNKLIHTGAVALALAGAVPAAQAAIYTLDFDGAVACGPNACSNFSAILSSHGDVAGVVDVQYDRNLAAAGPSQLSWWGPSYNDLFGVAWGDNGATSEIYLQPLDGLGVRLLDFDLGAYANTQSRSQITITTGAGTVLYSSGPITVGVFPGNLRSSYSFNLFSLDGIRIQWGPDAFNTGIDNIRFETGVVPEPSTYALLGAGLLGIGATLRRRGARRG
jgi:hypothetical protein